MAPPLNRGVWVRLLPRTLFAALVVWTAIDLVVAAPPLGWAIGSSLLIISVACTTWAARMSAFTWNRAGRTLLGLAFVGERLLWTGADPVLMMAFIVLLIGLGAMQSLERVFSRVYAAVSDPEILPMVDAAAFGAYARTLGLLALTFVVSLFLALLVPLSLFRSASLFTAVALSVVLIALIAILALAPSSSRGPEA